MTNAEALKRAQKLRDAIDAIADDLDPQRESTTATTKQARAAFMLDRAIGAMALACRELSRRGHDD